MKLLGKIEKPKKIQKYEKITKINFHNLLYLNLINFQF